jgi:hypothetical protein
MEIEVIDIINALFAQDAHLATAFAYMARAGKKADNSYNQEIGKARRWLEFGLEHHGGTIE